MIGATITVNEGEALLGLASQRALGERCMTGYQYGAGHCTLVSAGPLRGGSGGQWPIDQQRSADRAVRR